MALPIELVIFFMGIIGIIVGDVIPRGGIFKNASAILLIVLSVSILTTGITQLNNLTTLLLGSISFGIGSISLISDNFSEGEQKENFSNKPERRLF